MCGIVGVVAHSPVNQLLYDGMLLLQHRGQDAAGIVTSRGRTVPHAQGPTGMVRDVFRTRNMRDAAGQRRASAQCRYPTAGNACSEDEAQPFYVNSPFGITLGAQRQPDQRAGAEARAVHQPTAATSTPRATPRCCSTCSRTSSSDARAACTARPRRRSSPRSRGVHRRMTRRLRGGRDDRGPRPARVPRSVRHPPADRRAQRYGRRRRVMVASESVDARRHGLQASMRDVAPGEAIFVDLDGKLPRAPVRRATRS